MQDGPCRSQLLLFSVLILSVQNARGGHIFRYLWEKHRFSAFRGHLFRYCIIKIVIPCHFN